MFAVALWDARRGTLLLARDRFGIKPLYVAHTPHGLAFASEIAPLLRLGAERKPSLQAIADYLTLGYAPGTQTALASVERVAPGSVVSYTNGARNSRRYWQLGPPQEQRPLEDVLAEAVRLHLRLGRAPGASALRWPRLRAYRIACDLGEELGEPPRTFSVGFGDAAYDELHAARAVANALGSRHQEIAVRPDAANDLPRIVAQLEEPLADLGRDPGSGTSAGAVGAEVKVALAGDGGDEVFGGYSRYAWDPIAARIGSALPSSTLARVLERVPGLSRRGGRKDIGRRTLKLLTPTPHSRRPSDTCRGSRSSRTMRSMSCSRAAGSLRSAGSPPSSRPLPPA